MCKFFYWLLANKSPHTVVQVRRKGWGVSRDKISMIPFCCIFSYLRGLCSRIKSLMRKKGWIYVKTSELYVNQQPLYEILCFAPSVKCVLFVWNLKEVNNRSWYKKLQRLNLNPVFFLKSNKLLLLFIISYSNKKVFKIHKWSS